MVFQVRHFKSIIYVNNCADIYENGITQKFKKIEFSTYFVM